MRTADRSRPKRGSKNALSAFANGLPEPSDRSAFDAAGPASADFAPDAVDGTVDGTTLVLDLQPGPGSAFPSQMITFGERVLFTADDGSTGRELWSSDGTVGGTFRIRDIVTGPGSPDIEELVEMFAAAADRGEVPADPQVLGVADTAVIEEEARVLEAVTEGVGVRDGEDHHRRVGLRPAGHVVLWDDDHYYMGGVLAEHLSRQGLEVTYATPAGHASAWTIDEKDDLRIKMCIDVNGEDFKTIHHELGHNYYQRAYKEQSYLYRTSANDGFHEALGDVLSLSITPAYLTRIGLLESEPDASGDIGLLMRQALEKIAFLPFGLLVDQWRWKVFAGEVGPERYNEVWWQLREQYQGVAAPNERPADAFDPGAKYHVPGNTPYTRYFLAAILQFQFHRALCDTAGYDGPIHRCTIYGSAEAGDRLQAMMEMGRSRPWPEALEVLTGSPEMDAGAILDYFAPLQTWLEEQNAGRQCGW